MKIWINNPFDFLPGEGARLQRYGLLAQALARAGHDVVWWSSDWSHFEKKKRSVLEEAAVRRALELSEADGRIEIRLVQTVPYRHHVSLWRVWSHWRYGRRWLTEAGKACAAPGGRPDGVVVSLPPLGLWQAARHLKVPVVVDVQDLWPEVFYQVLPGCLRKLAPIFFRPLLQMAQQAYRMADGVSVAAEKYREVVGRTESVCFPLGVALPKGLRIEPMPFRLCYVGNLGWGYRLETCLDCLWEMQREGWNVSLDVAGDGPQRPLIEEAVAKGLPIRFHGVLKRNELDRVLRECTCGLVPMVAETCVGVPNKIFDYAAYGLVVISSLTGESRELLETYGAGVAYAADDAQSLKAALVGLYRDPERLLAMRKQSRRLAEERFDAARIYPEFAAWISRLFKAHVRAAGQEARPVG